MSPSFKGVLSFIIIIFFFFPPLWLGILHLRLASIIALPITIIFSVIAVILAYHAKKGGSKILGLIGLTLGIISIVISSLNLISVIPLYV